MSPAREQETFKSVLLLVSYFDCPISFGQIKNEVKKKNQQRRMRIGAYQMHLINLPLPIR